MCVSVWERQRVLCDKQQQQNIPHIPTRIFFWSAQDTDRWFDPLDPRFNTSLFLPLPWRKHLSSPRIKIFNPGYEKDKEDYWVIPDTLKQNHLHFSLLGPFEVQGPHIVAIQLPSTCWPNGICELTYKSQICSLIEKLSSGRAAGCWITFAQVVQLWSFKETKPLRFMHFNTHLVDFHSSEGHFLILLGHV